VLAVQLKRFKHNITWDGRFESQKLNTKVEFGTRLDLSDYVGHQCDEFSALQAPAGRHVYELQGVVVHSGQTIHSGHYYSFIRDPATGAWHRLDDDAVAEVSEERLREECFGGTVETKDQYGDIKREDRWRSAYVLFYRAAPAAPDPASPAPGPAFACPAGLREEVAESSRAAALHLLGFDSVGPAPHERRRSAEGDCRPRRVQARRVTARA
jgi:hypothetical protein